MQQNKLVFSSTNLSVPISLTGTGICLQTVRTVKIISYLRCRTCTLLLKYNISPVMNFSLHSTFFSFFLLLLFRALGCLRWEGGEWGLWELEPVSAHCRASNQRIWLHRFPRKSALTFFHIVMERRYRIILACTGRLAGSWYFELRKTSLAHSALR